MAAIDARTPPETKEKYRRARELEESGDSCFKCERVFATDEVVCLSRVRLGVNFLGSHIARILPLCEACLNPWDRSHYQRENRHAFGPNPCENCGRQLIVAHAYTWGRFLTCSRRCRRACENRAKREERATLRGPVIICADCGEGFTPSRSDSLYCSSACRQRAYRKRRLSPATGAQTGAQ